MEQGDRQLQELTKKTVVELRKMAKDMGLSGYSKLLKAQLILLIIQNKTRSSGSPPLSPKPSPKKAKGVAKGKRTSSDEWRGLGQMGVLPAEMMDKIYKELSPKDKAQMLQTNKLMKRILGEKVPENEKKKYIGVKDAGKILGKQFVTISQGDADRQKIPYLSTTKYGSVIVPKIIIDLIMARENLINGQIVPVKKVGRKAGNLDTIPKILNKLSKYHFRSQPNVFKIYGRIARSKKDREMAQILIPDLIMNQLIEYYLELKEDVERRLE
jgi:hypothetical protein